MRRKICKRTLQGPTFEGEIKVSLRPKQHQCNNAEGPPAVMPPLAVTGGQLRRAWVAMQHGLLPFCDCCGPCTADLCDSGFDAPDHSACNAPRPGMSRPASRPGMPRPHETPGDRWPFEGWQRLPLQYARAARSRPERRAHARAARGPRWD